MMGASILCTLVICNQSERVKITVETIYHYTDFFFN